MCDPTRCRTSQTTLQNTGCKLLSLSRRKLPTTVRRNSHSLTGLMRFAFKPPARLHAIEVAIEVDLQQRRGMIGRPARHRRRRSRKPQGGKVQFVDEDLNHPNRVLLADVILQAMR